MRLTKITLRNYRSIEVVSIDINPLAGGSYTYGLIGVNEAGKSSILKGIALSQNHNTIQRHYRDTRDTSKSIEILYHYELNVEEANECINIVVKNHPELIFTVSNFSTIDLKVEFGGEVVPKLSLVFKNINNDVDAKYLLDILAFFLRKIHKIIFWTAEEKYLISNPIDLDKFASNPDEISIPLKNCFLLAGINDIQKRINDALGDSTEREQLRDELSTQVTEHIKTVWPDHPIKISFDISDRQINFHIKDENVKGKAKTTEQRSDGFRQFISFLLTLSAENKNAALENTIILLDEPETHLHPKAQEDLLKELCKITSNDKNNIVFFATHSNYMIDKLMLNRNFKVTKPNDVTIVQQLDHKQSTYASVNYDVFDISSTDYHNELYGRICELNDNIELKEGEVKIDIDKQIQKLAKNCPIKNEYKQTVTKKYSCSLPTYIRHQIHHPENILNLRFTDKELNSSIKILLEVIETFQKIA